MVKNFSNREISRLRSTQRFPSNVMFEEGKITRLPVGLQAVFDADRGTDVENASIFTVPVQTAVHNLSEVSTGPTVGSLRTAGAYRLVLRNLDSLSTVAANEPDEDTICVGPVA